MGDPTRLTDGIPEHLYVDIESTIHQHMGHDGQSDETNDWVTDLMAALSPLIERALLAEAPQPKVLWRGCTMQATHRNGTNTGDVLIEGYAVLPGSARFKAPHGTHVVVVEDTETDRDRG